MDLKKEALSFDIEARQMEERGNYQEAAHLRYRAADLHEQRGDILNAARSFDRAAQNCEAALAQHEQTGISGQDEKLHNLGLQASINSGRLNFELYSRNTHDKEAAKKAATDAAYKWLRGAGYAKHAKDFPLAIALSDAAIEVFDEGEKLPRYMRQLLGELAVISPRRGGA